MNKSDNKTLTNNDKNKAFIQNLRKIKEKGKSQQLFNMLHRSVSTKNNNIKKKEL